jgi:hypothetical protein
MEYLIDVPKQGLIEAYGEHHPAVEAGQSIWLRLRGEAHDVWPLESG